MIDEKKFEKAQKIYTTICAAIENRGWHFEREDERLLVHFSVTGEDIPMVLIIVVDVERQIVRLMSRLPFKFKENSRLDGAVATCFATDKLIDGSFDYDLTTGAVTFRMTESYIESEIGEELFNYMINCACSTIDHYNDLFLAINMNALSVQDFIRIESA